MNRGLRDRIETVHVRAPLGILLALGFYASTTRYFPPESFIANPAIHQTKVEWYSSKLAALHEGSLWEVSQGQPSIEVYRFLWLRTFHHPVTVRINVTPG